MTVIAKVFMSGRSQAIRLPAKLRLAATEVRIDQVGNALWIQPEAVPGQNMADWLTAFYQASEPLPDTFLVKRSGSPAQVRDWS